MNKQQQEKRTYLIKFNSNRLKLYSANDWGDLLGLIYSLHLSNYRNIILIKEITDKQEIDKISNIIKNQDFIINKNKGLYISFDDSYKVQ